MRAQLLAFTVFIAAFVIAHQRPEGHSIYERQSCQGPSPGNPKIWWRAQIGHNGTTPFAADPVFEYYRTVVQHGADSSGKEDSSDAFNRAINAWNRTGNTVTTMPAYVYVPPGTYLLKKPIQMLVSTFLIGDPLNLPTLIADPALESHPVIHGYDEHQGEGGSTKNFYMAVRNFNIDTTRVPRDVPAKAIEWSVSQGCSLTNVHITMAPSSGHVGITMDEGGSGKIISDCSFTGGAIGILLANQQYMLKGLMFDGCNVGIFIQRSFVSTIQGCSFMNCNYGVDMGAANSSGALSIVDSSVSQCTAGVSAYVSGNGEGSLVLDNFAVSDAVAVVSASGSTLRQETVPAGQVWVMGNTNPDGYQSSKTYPINRPASLLVDGKYFTAPLPQYENYDISQVVSIKEDPDHPVYGDNTHDDGPSINAILLKHANSNCNPKIIFFPQGTYLTTTTIHIPPNTRLTGEVFSTISGSSSSSNSHFTDPSNPQPILRLGHPGDIGITQLTDLLVTVAHPLPGAILTQINTAGPNPGDVGIWNSVFRVGGAADTRVSTGCGARDPSGCRAAHMLLHVAGSASAYLEDVWGWVADHRLDGGLVSEPPQNIAVGRGVLVENQAGPAWLVGTSFEHCVLYQYALSGAKGGVYMGQHQTESPYWQGRGTPLMAPEPWTVDGRFGDPGFEGCEAGDDMCRRAWGLYVDGVRDVVIHGSAMWSFYGGMADGSWSDPQCGLTGGICQTNMAYVKGAKGMWWFSASSKSTENLVVDVGDGSEGGGSVVVTSMKDYPGAWGAVMAAYLRNTGGGDDGDEEKGDDSGARAMVSGLGLVVTILGVFAGLMLFG